MTRRRTDHLQIGVDRKFRLPRLWSNQELRRFAPMFTGEVINVSAWLDRDKEDGVYEEYFHAASSYTISNWIASARGFQSRSNEIFLDLTKDLNPSLVGKFDVVFSHTTLEHIYEIDKAFRNLCWLSRDVVIIVVPFMQQMHVHSGYGDFWRFTPLAVKRLFEDNGYQLIYLNFNEHKRSSVYIFAIASKHPERWTSIQSPFSLRSKGSLLDGFEKIVGCHAITNPWTFKIRQLPTAILRRVKTSNEAQSQS